MHIKILLFFLLANFPIKNKAVSSNQKTNNISEIKKCIFLQKQLLPKKQKSTFTKKLTRVSAQLIIPVIISFISCKIFDIFLIKNKNSLTKKEFSKLKTRRATLNKILFSLILTGNFFIIRFILKEKETNNLEILKEFLKNWTKNKKLTPTKFYKKLESIHSLYQKNKKLPLTKAESKKFIRSLISKIIEYKIHLKYKNIKFLDKKK